MLLGCILFCNTEENTNKLPQTIHCGVLHETFKYTQSPLSRENQLKYYRPQID